MNAPYIPANTVPSFTKYDMALKADKMGMLTNHTPTKPNRTRISSCIFKALLQEPRYQQPGQPGRLEFQTSDKPTILPQSSPTPTHHQRLNES
jgi:hypothetical protein